jgi:hypothetical protein
MKSPFQKLIRISAILFVAVLLFNFFGYYLMHLNSTQNYRFIEAKAISGRQQTLSQIIAKDAAVLANDILDNKQVQALKDSLANTLTVFQQQQDLLQKETEIIPLPVPEAIFQIKLLYSNTTPYYKGIVAIGKELVQSDSALLSINKAVYLRAMLSNNGTLRK